MNGWFGFILDDETDVCFFKSDIIVFADFDERVGDVNSNGFGRWLARYASECELDLDVEFVVEELVGVGGGGVMF